MQISLIFALVIAAIAVLFAAQNNDTTTVAFLAWQFRGSLALILLLAVAAGVLISSLASLPTIVRSGWRQRSHRRRISELEAEIATYQSRLADARTELETQRAAASPPPASPPASSSPTSLPYPDEKPRENKP